MHNYSGLRDKLLDVAASICLKLSAYKRPRYDVSQTHFVGNKQAAYQLVPYDGTSGMAMGVDGGKVPRVAILGPLHKEPFRAYPYTSYEFSSSCIPRVDYREGLLVKPYTKNVMLKYYNEDGRQTDEKLIHDHTLARLWKRSGLSGQDLLRPDGNPDNVKVAHTMALLHGAYRKMERVSRLLYPPKP